MSRILARLGISLMILYVGSYALLYLLRPAGESANGLYFVYTRGRKTEARETREMRETVMYYFYYPVYKVHSRLGGQKHNYDRPAPTDVGDF